jgi:hypothetical protein
MANVIEPYILDEMKADVLEMPALEKHAWKGGVVTESAVEGGFARMMLIICSRMPEELL